MCSISDMLKGSKWPRIRKINAFFGTFHPETMMQSSVFWDVGMPEQFDWISDISAVTVSHD